MATNGRPRIGPLEDARPAPCRGGPAGRFGDGACGGARSVGGCRGPGSEQKQNWVGAQDFSRAIEHDAAEGWSKMAKE